MKSLSMCLTSAIMAMVSTGAVAASAEDSTAMQHIVDRAVSVAKEKFPTLKTNQIAVTLINLTHPEKLERGSCRGNDKIYPASVIKLFYLSAIHRWMEDGK